MSLKILVTNDDGIDSIGLKYLVEHAKKYGEVTVIAPKKEQSAKSQAIEVRKSIECKKVDKNFGVETYSIDSTPTDCVRFAKYGLKKDFDLILSGINSGYNVGEDIWYSGTVSVVFEAVSIKAKAIAFSVIKSSNEGFIYFDMCMDYILNNKLLDVCDIYNVNIPANAKGIKITKQGFCNFDTWFREVDKDEYIQEGVWNAESRIEKIEIDSACVANDYISITPLTANRTNKEAFDILKNKKDLQ